MFFQIFDINRFRWLLNLVTVLVSLPFLFIPSPQLFLFLFIFIYSLSSFLPLRFRFPRNSETPFSRSPENLAIYGTSSSQFSFHTSLRSLLAPKIADYMLNPASNHFRKWWTGFDQSRVSVLLRNLEMLAGDALHACSPRINYIVPFFSVTLFVSVADFCAHFLVRRFLICAVL